MWFSLVAAVFALFVLFIWYWQRRRRSIAHLPGPPSDSWLVGNIPDFDRAESACDADFEWTKKYGNVFRFRGCFGEDVLFVADPKAMQYILNTGGYNFPKSWETSLRMRLITGRGILTEEGAQHARLRRVMNPSFSHGVVKTFLPLFWDSSRKVTAVWKATIRKQSRETCIMDVSSLLARATLDIIGEAAFNYKFGAIEAMEPRSDLHKVYHNLLADTQYKRSDSAIVFTRLLGYAPIWLSDILTCLPTEQFQRLNSYMKVARSTAKALVKKELEAQASVQEGGKDLMSLFIKANHAEDPKRRLEEEEILPQITSLLIAGHDTTANTLGWALYGISKNSEAQSKLRTEIQALRYKVASRGDTEMTIQDLDSMKYMNAVLSETLRYHPIAMQLQRRALRYDAIPLEAPLRTASGNMIRAIPVRKGQVIHVGLAAYNRLYSIWGEDAHQWRPERFLEVQHKEDKTPLGVYANLATFSSGLRGCIGWRFALVEMQTVLIELLDNFEFNPAPGVEIRRVPAGGMQSMVKGQEDKGTQMLLSVSIIPDRDAGKD